MLSEKRKMIIGAVALLLLSGLFFSPNASATSETTLTLTFDQNTKEIDVSPNGSGTVIFYGTLNCSSSDYKRTIEFEVSVEGNGTENWNVSISPAYITIDWESCSIPTNVSVVVPLGTGSSISGNITVTVTHHPWGTGENPTKIHQHLSVVVKPYYGLSISCIDNYKETVTGNNLTFDIEAHNDGNTNETFGWFVENEDGLNSNGVTTNFVFQELIVENNSIGHNTLWVNISKQTEPNTYEIKIYVSSENVSDNLTLTVLVKKAETEIEKPVLIPDIGIAEIIIILTGCTALIGLRKIHLTRWRRKNE